MNLCACSPAHHRELPGSWKGRFSFLAEVLWIREMLSVCVLAVPVSLSPLQRAGSSLIQISAEMTDVLLVLVLEVNCCLCSCWELP